MERLKDDASGYCSHGWTAGRRPVALLVALSVFGTSAASAQQSAEPRAERPRAIEEVVVTAQRRAETLQSVPLAITAFTESDLRASGISGIKDLTERAPGFTMGQFNQSQPQLYIRGIGSNEDGSAGDQSVIVYIDEVYIGRSAGIDIDLFGLERAEILRGPQGTLFGRNVVGGAVNLITKKPTAEPEVRFEGTLGSFDRVDTRALFSGPLADNLFGQISFSSRKRDGFLRSEVGRFPEFFPETSQFVLDNLRSHGENSRTLRGSLRFLPLDNLELNLTGAVSSMSTSAPNRVFRGGGPLGLSAEALVPGITESFRKGMFEREGKQETDTMSLALRAEYEFDNGHLLTSITSWREVDTLNDSRGGGPNLSALYLSAGVVPQIAEAHNDHIEHSETLTQEIRLTSPSAGRIEWVGGVFLMREEVQRDETLGFGLKALDPMGNPFDILPVRISGDDEDARTLSYAVFGQATYEVVEGLRLTVGGRYSYDDKRISRIITADGVLVPEGFAAEGDESWSKFTPMARIEYQASEDIFFYSSVATGYKAGGFQGRSQRPLAASTPFDPEEALMFEIGARTEWFDGRLQLNPTLFHIDYTDLQVLQALQTIDAPIDEPATIITQNAADAEVRGAELEFTLIPVDGLRVRGSYTYLDTKFTDFFIPDGFRPPTEGSTGIDRTGNRLRNAPKHAANVLVRYDWPQLAGGSMWVQGEWMYKGKAFQDPDNLDFAAVPSYEKVDIRVGYLFPRTNIEVVAWVENALNEGYLVHNFPFQGGGLGTPGMPRAFGVTLDWSL